MFENRFIVFEWEVFKGIYAYFLHFQFFFFWFKRLWFWKNADPTLYAYTGVTT